MKLAVIIKILQITGMRISTAQHYSISDIKGRFSFYCVCSVLEEEGEEAEEGGGGGGGGGEKTGKERRARGGK